MNAAKAYYYANAGAWFDIIDTTIFFGDPALTLRLPPGSAAAWLGYREEWDCGEPFMDEPAECPVL